jgi:hypothetical protein
VPAGLYSDTLRPHVAGARFYPIFLSSGQDAEVLRDRVDRVIHKCLNAQLSARGWPVHFPVWRWEDVEARAADRGETVNDTFVQMARESSVVIVLLHDELRPGTRDELLSVKDDPDVDLKVLWFHKSRRLPFRRSSSVAEFLETHKDSVLHTRISEQDGEDAWIALVRNLVSTLLKALRSDQREPYVEDR